MYGGGIRFVLGGRKEKQWQKKRPEHVRSCTPHSGAEKSVRKGFYAGKGHNSETILWWLVENGSGRSWRFGGWLEDKA